MDVSHLYRLASVAVAEARRVMPRATERRVEDRALAILLDRHAAAVRRVRTERPAAAARRADLGDRAARAEIEACAFHFAASEVLGLEEGDVKGSGKIRQIHADVGGAFWERLVSMTEWWKDRSAVNICRFALSELAVDLDDDEIQVTSEPAAKGDQHVQVWTEDLGEAELWDRLGDLYGSKSTALRVALQHLSDWLEVQDDDGYEA
jgi:hypothetical protein